MLPSRWHVFQQGNARPHTAAITTAWLRSRRVRVLNWPACSPDLSPIDNIWHIKQKMCQRQQTCPRPNYFAYSRHQIWNELICALNCKISQLKMYYVIYVLLWIKCWLVWFEILLVFILFKFKKTSQHFQNLGCTWIQEHRYESICFAYSLIFPLWGKVHWYNNYKIK